MRTPVTTPAHTPPVAQTIPAALHAAAQTFGSAPALADGSVRLDWTQLLAEVQDVARALIARGIQVGDRVAIWSPNTWHWVVAALGAHYAGATLIPLNTRYVADEVVDVLHRVDAKALFIAGTFLKRDRLAELRAAAPDLNIGTVVVLPVEGSEDRPDGALNWSDLAETATAVRREQVIERGESVSAEDLSDILFTSGTTGRSKGVLIEHRQTLSTARAWTECATLNSADNYLIVNPFFHSFGYKAGIIACLVTGATIVPQIVFDVPTTMRLIDQEKITVLPGPPTIYQTILDFPGRDEYDLNGLRVAVTGAAPVPVALVERMRAELDFDVVLTAYGLSESSGFGTMCRVDDDAETISGTSGRPIAGFELKLSDAGEILLRGPNVMRGYLDDPESTAKTIDADGWLHTGDIGSIDDRGYLTITDRLKDMYVSGGFNVYPAEIEQALARLDGVATSAVIGVPDQRMGEVGKAYIVRKPGATLTEDQVFSYATKVLANFKVPRFVEFRDELPYNASGKVLKRQLREENS
ncbi:FadD3 family acyl-CoA ligase [Nocardia carnea]|uniref:FadD3 family acyl-CoA ligase n=1 Tax=Nocardia carnea TaxID=37328 RepID=UPI002454C12A|nr:FadD3 family acyl-CoA ligase [Nocardia carnea]